MSDSASAKIAVVVGIGAVVLGIAALRSRYASHDASHSAESKPTSAVVPTASSASSAATTTTGAPEDVPGAAKPAEPRGPAQADRIALLDAASAGDQAKIEALFAKGVNLDGTLENAAKSGNAALVGWLIGHGVDAKEDEDLTVPPILIADEHDAVVTLLLTKGAHEPTLAKAVAAGAPKAVSRILAKGKSFFFSPAGEPVLMVALRNTAGAKRRVIVEALLKASPDVNVKYEEETPLSVAVTNAVQRGAAEDEKAGDRPLDIVARLVALQAKVDGEALVSALGAEEGRGPLLDVLLGGTLDRGATARAISAAANNHDAASIKKLGAKGVTWSALDPHAPPPLASAIVASDVTMVRALLDAGAPMDRLGEEGDTALLAAVAAAAGDSDDALRVVRVLLEHGASPNKRGRDGRTALFAAAQQGSDTLVALLVSKGARVDDAVDGRTPFEAADARGHDAVTKILKARGAKVPRPPADVFPALSPH